MKNRKLKALAISDTHGWHHQIKIDKDIDLVIIPGDVTNHRNQAFNDIEFQDFYNWTKTVEQDIILIAGNHCGWALRKYNKDKIKDTCIYLEHEYVDYKGRLFFGSPYTPTFGDWSFMVNRGKLDRYWEALTEGIDVLVTHGPPQGILDLSLNKENILEFCGDKALLRHIERVNPGVHLFGHCVDSNTEILTMDGWKKYNEIESGTNIYSYNIDDNIIEEDIIKDVIIKDNYIGPILSIQNSIHSIRVTAGHTMLYLDHKNNVRKKLANDINSSYKYLTAAEKNNKDYEYYNDDELRLMILISSDGHLEYDNTNYVRFHLKKANKINYLCDLLDRLGLKYNKKLQKSGNYKISFNLMDKKLYLKELPKHIINLSKRQFDIILEAYEYSDGHRVTDNYIEVYTNSVNNADLIQTLCVLNDYKCIKELSSNNICFRMLIRSKSSVSASKKFIEKSYSDGELFWCVTTKNKTFISRRNGRVMITGNCHNHRHVINYGSRTTKNVDTIFYNCSGVVDAKFDLGLVNPGHIIEI